MPCAAFVAPSLLCCVLASCASYTVIPDAQRTAIDEAHTGELLYLKQSMYVGQFYDDDRFKLLHPRRFEELTYLQTAEGEAIAPPPAEGVIPAGTRVRVEKIEWPTGDVVFRRPLYTPRYTTWIMLRVAAERGTDVTLERNQRHVLLLPGGIEDRETFDAWYAASLTQEDPNPWLVSLPQDQQRAVAQKKAIVGMSYDALTAAWGFPDRVSRDVVPDGDQQGQTRELCLWSKSRVTLVAGKVTRIDTPRVEHEHGNPRPTDAPTTDAPTTNAPTTDAPTTDAPTTTDAAPPAG